MRSTVKHVLSDHSKKDQKMVFKTDYSLMQVKSIAECIKRFKISALLSTCIKVPSVFRPLFCLVLSGRLRQVLLYIMGNICVKF